MLLSNMFNNKLNDFVDSSDKEDVISCHQNKNAISPQLPAIGRDRVAGHSKPEKQIKGVKKDTFDVSFLYQRIIKCN